MSLRTCKFILYGACLPALLLVLIHAMTGCNDGLKPGDSTHVGPGAFEKLSAALDEEAWHHAACLSIAEGAPGWEDSPLANRAAAVAVKKLRHRALAAEAEVSRLRGAPVEITDAMVESCLRRWFYRWDDVVSEGEPANVYRAEMRSALAAALSPETA